MLKSYHYEGPLPLGSVVAHNCGAAGLFSNKVNPQVTLIGKEVAGLYTLAVNVSGQEPFVIHGNVTSIGRRKMGQQLLAYLRGLQGLASYNEWGSLVGVRPTKLFHKYRDKAPDAASVANWIEAEFSVSPEKLGLLTDIGEFQRPYVDPNIIKDTLVSLYCGIPFCQTHCVYCSFPYGMWQNYGNHNGFIEALEFDMDHMAHMVQEHELDVMSLYMGGGTPTILPDLEFERVLAKLSPLVPEEREFTVEAGRPDSVTPEKINTMVRHEVNRISINPQTMQDAILARIGRGHTAQDIDDLYQYVKRHTSLAVNMDFIAGLPEQTDRDMTENMDYICRSLPENVTIHTLALKKGSPLYESHMQQRLPNEEQVRHMVNVARERLETAGYRPYYLYRQQYMTGQLENIGYTLEGHACDYNIRMMEERQSVLSMGPGSSSKWMRAPEFRQKKQHMPKDVDVYIRTIEQLLDKRSALCKSFWEVV